MPPLPNPALRSILAEAYSPCSFFGKCKQAQWNPKTGHVPRGFLGASGSREDVELVMVFSEPGHPHKDERYDPTATAEYVMSKCVAHAYDSFKNGTDLFHRNARWFIDQLYPDLDFDEQMNRVWLTEGRLCSIENEIGGTMDRLCASNFLARQIAALPNATVVAFGGKAKKYLQGLGVDFIGAYALAPPGANHKPARPSWEHAIAEVIARR